MPWQDPDPDCTAPPPWPALARARQADPLARVPMWVQRGDARLHAGSVARAHLPLLARWPAFVRLQAGQTQGEPALPAGCTAVELTGDAPALQAWLDALHPQLAAAGAIRGWRDERFALLPLPADGSPPATGTPPLATIERAAARFWGSASFGAHCNGYVADGSGRPTHLWIARRSDTKPTDPGKLDNLIGGGVPHGQSPRAAVVREGWEEAGLTPPQMDRLQPGRRLRVARDLPEGFQLEWLSVFDLALPAGLMPANQDGEVQALQCLPIAQALSCAASGAMTVDAELVTLDFALRHRLLPEAEARRLEPRLLALACGSADQD